MLQNDTDSKITHNVDSVGDSRANILPLLRFDGIEAIVCESLVEIQHF